MIIRLLRERPWIWVVIAFIVLILSWIVLFNLALKQPVLRVEPGEPLPEGVVPGSGHPSAQNPDSKEGDR